MAAGKSSNLKTKKKQKTSAKAPARDAARKPSTKPGRARPAAKKRPPAAKKAAPKQAVRRPARPAAGVVDPGTLGVSPTYLKALADYEKAMTIFHKREFGRAQGMFDEVIEKYPGEGDLADRARVYGNLCRRQTEARVTPQGFDDCYYRGVVLSNQGDFDGAQEFFQKALRLRSDSGKVHYSLAACQAQLGDVPRALASLRRAVELDADSRLHARNDDDFLPLKGTPEFDEIVGLGEPEMPG